MAKIDLKNNKISVDTSKKLPSFERSTFFKGPVREVDPQQQAGQLINTLSGFQRTFGQVAETGINIEKNRQKDILREEIDKSFQDFSNTIRKDNPDAETALTQYDEQSQDFIDGIVGRASPLTKRFARNYALNRSNRYRSPIWNDVITQNHRRAVADAMERNRNSHDQLIDQIWQTPNAVDENELWNQDRFRPVAKQTDLHIQNTADDFEHGLVTRGAFEHSLGFRKTVQQQMMMKNYHDAVLQGPKSEEKFLNRFRQSKVEGLNDQDKLDLINGPFQSIRTGLVGRRKGNAQQSKRNWNNALLRMKKTGIIDSEAVSQRQLEDPDNARFYQAQAEAQQSIHQFGEDILGKTPREVNQLLAEREPSPNDEFLTTRQKAFDQMANLAKQYNNTFDKDPKSAIEQSGEYQQALDEWKQVQRGEIPNTNPGAQYGEIAPHPDDIAENVYRRAGIAPHEQKYLTNQRSKQIAQSINNLQTPEDLSRAFEQLRQTHPNHFVQVVNQLSEDGLSDNKALVANIDPLVVEQNDLAGFANSDPKELKARMLEANKREQGETGVTSGSGLGILSSLVPFKTGGNVVSTGRPKDDIDALTGRIDPVLIDQAGVTESMKQYLDTKRHIPGALDSETVNSTIDNIRNLSYYLYLNNDISPIQAGQRAMDIWANRFSYIKINDRNLMIPSQFDETVISNKLQEIEKNKVNQIDWKLTDVGTLNGTTEDDKLSIQEGFWALEGDQRHVVRVDSNGKRRFDKDGIPLVVDLNDLQNESVEKAQGLYDLLTTYRNIDLSPEALSEQLNKFNLVF